MFKLLNKILIIVVVVLVIALVGSLIFYNTKGFKITTETMELSFKDIGELATEEVCAKEVSKVANEDLKLLGITIPNTAAFQIISCPVNIKAGIDFKEIKLDPDESSKTIKVKLPEAKVISREVDNEHLTLWDDHAGLFNEIHTTQFNQALVDIGAKAEKSAIDNGLLTKAKSNAETLIKGFLAKGYNLEEYKVVFI